MLHLNKKLNICIAGEGGQGAQTVAKIIVNAAYNQKVPVAYVPNYGVEQRGGVSIAFVRTSSDVISYPKFSIADIMVLLSDRSIDRVEQHIGPKTSVFYNMDFVERKLPKKNKGFHFNEMAREMGSTRLFNMIVLGLVVKTMDSIPLQTIIKEAHNKFAKKYVAKPELKKLNEEAIKYGYNLV
ncbi:MAG: 2-oxoacid:acceptor oxidoreductase family protein [Candidatus Komeilibacteria bacterium]